MTPDLSPHALNVIGPLTRSPLCKLIAAEDLFALMDALEEPVPEEVYQHLENIHAHEIPLVIIANIL